MGNPVIDARMEFANQIVARHGYDDADAIVNMSRHDVNMMALSIRAALSITMRVIYDLTEHIALTETAIPACDHAFIGAQIMDAVETNHKIMAIRHMRAATGMSLVNAKQAIDGLMAMRDHSNGTHVLTAIPREDVIPPF